MESSSGGGSVRLFFMAVVLSDVTFVSTPIIVVGVLVALSEDSTVIMDETEPSPSLLVDVIVVPSWAPKGWWSV